MFGFDSCRPGPDETTMRSLDAALKGARPCIPTGRPMRFGDSFRRGLASASRAGTIMPGDLDHLRACDFPADPALWPAKNMVFQVLEPNKPGRALVVRVQLGLEHVGVRLTAFGRDHAKGQWEFIEPQVLREGFSVELENDAPLTTTMIGMFLPLQVSIWEAAALVSQRFQDLTKATRH